ncbi:MAG: chemotaxis protein CheW [Leptospiraceae bacterium]|nr:chemotaxis protein CheW [Leptospiraceae bacterium]
MNNKTEKRQLLLIWEISNSLFGINIKHCKEVQKGVPLNPIPTARPFIKGLVNLRGETSVVCDLLMLLNYGNFDEAGGKPEVIIKLQYVNKNISFLANSVVEIVSYQEEELQEASSYLSFEECEFINKLYDSEYGIVKLIDIEKIMLL